MKLWLTATMTDSLSKRRLTEFRQRGLPIAVVLLAVLLAWYGGAWALNSAGAVELVLPQDGAWRWTDLLAATMQMDRPVLPAPHQVDIPFSGSAAPTFWPSASMTCSTASQPPKMIRPCAMAGAPLM